MSEYITIEDMRKSFEQVTAPSFGHEFSYPRKSNGEYINPTLEDHWQTFQEGWEACEAQLSIRRTPKATKNVCHNKINGTCQMHNLQCGFPNCEK